VESREYMYSADAAAIGPFVFLFLDNALFRRHSGDVRENVYKPNKGH